MKILLPFSQALGSIVNCVSFNPSIHVACNDALHDVQNRCALTIVSTIFYYIINNYYLVLIKVIEMFSELFCTGLRCNLWFNKIANKYLGSWIGILGSNCYPCYFQVLTL